MTISRGMGRQTEEQEPRQHPFALAYDPLKEALGELAGSLLVESAGSAILTLHMPSTPKGPMHSPELIVEETGELRGTAFKPWNVVTLVLDPNLALDFLLALPDNPPHGVAFGSSLRFWTTAAKFTFELITRQSYMPTVQETQSNGDISLRAAWKAVLASDDAERLQMLSSMMPPSCRAFLPPGAKKASVPQEIVHHFLNQSIDAFVRASISPRELLPTQRSRRSRAMPLAEQWLQALASDDPALTAPAQELKHFSAAMHAWLNQIRPVESNLPFRTCFRLDAPADDGEGSLDWHISYHLQANDDRSLLVPAEKVWKERSDTLTFLKRKFENPQERLLADLGKAAHLFPAIEESLRTARPKGLKLHTEQAYAFLRESAPLLEQSGFGVLVPPWWQKSSVGLSVLDIEGDGWVRDLLAKLSDSAKIAPIETTSTFQGRLRPYQLKGVSWLAFLKQFGFAACLADDMGLGKTIQFITLLLHDRTVQQDTVKPGPALLICPMSIVGNWHRELQRFAPSLRVMIHHGHERLSGDAFAAEAKHHDIGITTYSLALRDKEHLAPIDWEYVVVDEAQNIKNEA